MGGILFILLLLGSLASFSGMIYFINERGLKRKRKKHISNLKKIIENFHADNLKPILKERNITNFFYKEGNVQFEVAYNESTIYGKIRDDIYKDSDFEVIYSFEYDIKNKSLIFTNREGYTYLRYGLYESINYHLSLFAEKLIQVDWDTKQKEPIEKDKKNSKPKKNDSFNEKTKMLIKNVKLLQNEEKEYLTGKIMDELEKTMLFYNRLSVSEKLKYEPVIFEKLKDIEDELEEIINTVEERKYQSFKEKLRKLSIEEE